MSENEWLTDDLILASQKILREQISISGFQDPILGEIKKVFLSRGRTLSKYSTMGMGTGLL